MSRPRTPTNILEMRGTFKANPQRRDARRFEPQPEDLGEITCGAPEHLSEPEADMWRWTVANAPWLRAVDLPTVERFAHVFVLCRDSEKFLTAPEHTLQKYMVMLGLSAVDRSKIVTPPKKKQSKYESA